LAADVKAVWQAIVEVERWPEWWPSVQSVMAIAQGDTRGVGTVYRFTWRGRLPYRLAFDMRVSRVEPYELLEGVATGDLEGFGVWHLSSQGDKTRIRYEWIVITTKWWMNLLAPVLRSAFHWNHDRVMNEGGEGLARRLHCELLSTGHESTVGV
jgi:hypothetical protein